MHNEPIFRDPTKKRLKPSILFCDIDRTLEIDTQVING